MRLPLNLSGLWHDLLSRRPRQNRHLADAVQLDLHEQVNAAHREWLAAQQYFQSVSEPELVDHAVHTMIAAEHKYMYLLRKLRTGQQATDIQEG